MFPGEKPVYQHLPGEEDFSFSTEPELWPASAFDDPGRVRPYFDWQLRTRTLPLGGRTRIMAVVHLTPDTFSASPAAAAKLALAAALEALDHGADILDLGAEPPRPNALPFTAEEEQARLLPVLEAVLHARPEAIVSVATCHAATARAAALRGAEIVNDAGGLAGDIAMASTVATTGCGLVLMHTRGRPADVSALPPIPHDEVVSTVFSGLCEGVALAEAVGIAGQRLLLDPGFGLGKRGAENLALLAGLGRLRELGRPVLAGLSRKKFLAETLASAGLPAEDRSIATVAAATAAVLAGAHILRVHDVPAARQAAAIADAVLLQQET